MNATLAVGVGLLTLGLAGLAVARRREPGTVTHRATVDGRSYLVSRLGGGMYRVERRQGEGSAEATIATILFSAADPPRLVHEEGVPWAIDLAKADIYKFPADLFDEIVAPPADSPVDYSGAP